MEEAPPPKNNMYIAINFEKNGFPWDNGTNFDIISLNLLYLIAEIIRKQSHMSYSMYNCFRNPVYFVFSLAF